MHIDIFLKEFNTTRYEVSKITGISEQTLSKANNRDASTYSIKLVECLAKATGILPEEVLRKLLDIKNKNVLYVATNANEVQQALTASAKEFIVKGEMNVVAKEVRESDVSEDAKFIVNAGTFGGASFIYWLMHIISNMSKKDDEKFINNIKFKIITYYDVEPIDSYSARLTLKDFVGGNGK